MKKVKKVRVNRLAVDPIEGEQGVLPEVRIRQKRVKVRAHRRVNDTFLGPAERVALTWLAERMPPWVTPDLLTAVGFLSAVLIFAGYLLTNLHPAFLWLASLGFLINWFGDSLDGTLARYRHIERPKYGYYLDHSVDALNEAFIFLGAGLSPYLHFEVAALALIAYLLLSVHVFLSTYVLGEFRLSYFSLGPTETRVIAVSINTILFFTGQPMIHLLGMDFTVYDLVAAGLALGLFAAFINSSLRSAAALSKIEEKKE